MRLNRGLLAAISLTILASTSQAEFNFEKIEVAGGTNSRIAIPTADDGKVSVGLNGSAAVA